MIVCSWSDVNRALIWCTVMRSGWNVMHQLWRTGWKLRGIWNRYWRYWKVNLSIRSWYSALVYNPANYDVYYDRTLQLKKVTRRPTTTSTTLASELSQCFLISKMVKYGHTFILRFMCIPLIFVSPISLAAISDSFMSSFMNSTKSR